MAGLRFIDGIDEPRAKYRATLVHRVTAELQLGIEYNPAGDDVGPLANWRLLDETASAPALIVGTSSDRIGTSEGRAYYATLSKSLDAITGLPVSPYAGVVWGGSDHQLRGIGGLVVRWAPLWTSTHSFDGVNLHHLLERRLDARSALGLLLVEQEGEHHLGLTWSRAF